MKKLLALALALMLLLASAALAENASILDLSNMALSVTRDGQEQTMDLTGVNARLAIGAPEGVATMELVADDGSETLLDGVLQVVDNKVVVDIDGMQKAIAAAIPAESLQGLGADPTATIGELFAGLAKGVNVKLPAFRGVDIPKVDVMAIVDFLPMLGIQAETDSDGVATFTVPWELLKQVLSLVTQMVPAEQLGGAGDFLNSLANSDDGFALEGRIADDGTTAELLLDLYLVSGGQTTDTAFGGLYFGSTANADTIDVLLYQDGQSFNLVEINLVSDPAAATLAATADIAGAMKLTFSLYPDEKIEGAQVVAMELSAEETTILAASLNYGEQGDSQFADFAIEANGNGETAQFSYHIDEHPEADGSMAGTLVVYVKDRANETAFSADVTESTGDFDFRAIADTTNVYDAENMTEAENQAFGEDLNNALAPLYSFLSNIEVQTAA